MRSSYGATKRHAETRVLGYANTHYRRPTSRRSRPGRSRGWTFVPVLVLLGIVWFGYNWYQDVLAGEQDCTPFCGILPGPGGSPDEATFDSARGWRVTYREDWFGEPVREGPEGIEWRFGDDQSLGLVATSERDPQRSCEKAGDALPAGFQRLFSIPNAGIGDRVGVGTAFEKTIARPGKAPVRVRHFQVCVAAGGVGLIGFAEGPRERKPVATHADPATTETAFLLGELAAAVEYVDDGGRVLSLSRRG